MNPLSFVPVAGAMATSLAVLKVSQPAVQAASATAVPSAAAGIPYLGTRLLLGTLGTIGIGALIWLAVSSLQHDQ